MNNAPTTDRNRFAELAYELLGSKIATEFLQEAWKSASPEVKRQLADSMIQSLTKQIKSDDYGVLNCLRDIVKQITIEMASERDQEIRTAVKSVVDNWQPTAVNKAIVAAAEYATQYVTPKVIEEMRKALHVAW